MTAAVSVIGLTSGLLIVVGVDPGILAGVFGAALLLLAIHRDSRSHSAKKQIRTLKREQRRLTFVAEDLEVERSRKAMALRLANSAAWEADPQDGSFACSADFGRILKLPKARPDGLDQFFGDFVSPKDRSRVATAWRTALREGEPFDEEYRVGGDETEGRWVKTYARLFPARDEDPERVVGLTIDIDDRKARERTIAIAKREAQEASRMKSEFIANMSHELRTPLNGVNGMCDLLRGTNLNAQQQEYVEIIRDSGWTLLGLINDVLDLSKIEAGILELKKETFRADQLIEDTRRAVSGMAHEKDIRLITFCEPASWGPFEGDVKRIRQVLLNLAGNAVKFCDTGQVSISAERVANLVRFSVEDTGPGIPQEKADKMFERFVQGDGSSTRRFGGAGLGLAISRDLVTLMNGQIGVDSEEDVGSCFWFELPLGRADSVDETVELVEGGPEFGGRLEARILVVDDNRINRKVATALLEAQGAEVRSAEDGMAALGMLAAEPFDIVLMDLEMPVLSGKDTILRIRASGEPYADVPIIAITAHSADDAKEGLIASGADAFVAKPIEAEELLSLAERCLVRASDVAQAS